MRLLKDLDWEQQCICKLEYFLNEIEYLELKRLSKFSYGIGINYKKTEKELVERAHENGLKVHVFTLNNKKEVEKMKEIKVDGGFNNNP